jgi:hypothetical protein
MSYDCLMRVVTVNVCGIRSAAAKGLFRWLRRQRADFICLQETKSQEHQLEGHDIELKGYHRYFCDAERKGYSGVALYTRHRPERVVRGFGIDEFDREGRYIEAQVGGLSVAGRTASPGLEEPLPRRLRAAPAAPATQTAALHPQRGLEYCAPAHRPEKLAGQPEELRFPARGTRLDGPALRSGRLR